MAHATSFVSSPRTSKSNQRNDNRRLIGNLPQKWHPDKVTDFPMLCSENFPALSSASLSNSDGLYGYNCEMSRHYEKQSDISYSDKLQKNINNPSNSSLKLNTTEGQYSYKHNENPALSPNDSDNHFCSFKSRTIGVNKNSAVKRNSHIHFSNPTCSEKSNISASVSHESAFRNTKPIPKRNNLCLQNKSSKASSNNSFVPHQIGSSSSDEQNRKFNICPLGISNAEEKSFKNINSSSSAERNQLHTKETRWKSVKHKGVEHKRLSDPKNSEQDSNPHVVCTEINRKRSDTDFQAYKQRPHMLRKSNMYQKHENEKAKNKSTQSANGSFSTHDNDGQQSVRKHGMHTQERFVSKNNLVKDSDASKLEQESKKKRRKKRLSKIKRETLFQTGKLLILTPEFHSHLIHKLEGSKPNSSNNEIVDINNPNEYPSLNSSNFVCHQPSMQVSQKNQNRDEPVGTNNNCVISSTYKSLMNAERTSDKNSEKTNQVTWPSILEDKSQVFKTSSKDRDSDHVDCNAHTMPTFAEKPEEEIEVFGKVKQCPRQPIQLFDILTTTKPKDKAKKKSSILSQVTTFKKNKNGNLHGLNVLDSSAPNIKRGKERETPKRKKITTLKKIILSERLKMKEMKKLAKKPFDSSPSEGDSKFVPSSEVIPESSVSGGKEVYANFKYTFSELQLEFLRISENLQFKHLVSANPKGIFHNFIVKDIILTARSVVNNCIKMALEEIKCMSPENDICENSGFYEDNTKTLSDIQTSSEVDFHEDALTNIIDHSLYVTPFQHKDNVKASSANGELSIEYFLCDTALSMEKVDPSSMLLNESMKNGSLNVKQSESELRFVDEILLTNVENKLSTDSSNDASSFCESQLCSNTENTEDLKDADVKELKLLGCPEDKVQQAIETLIYTKTFRRYCSHFLSQELNEAVLLLIENLARFQDRLHQKDPVKARMKRRLLYGIKEVTKHLKLKKLKCVIVAPDMEDIKSEGGLNIMLNSLIQIAKEYHIPCIFAADRKQLGKACHKSVPVSCVGVFSYEGSEVSFKKIIELHTMHKKAYEDFKKILNDNLTDNNVKEIVDVKEKSPHDLIFIRTKILKSILSKVDNISSITSDDASDAFTWYTTKFLLKLHKAIS